MLSIKNGVKQEDTLSPWICNFALEHVITRVQVNQDGLKLSGTHRLLVYADDVNLCVYVSHRFVDSFRAGSGWNCSIKKFVTIDGHMNVKL